MGKEEEEEEARVYMRKKLTLFLSQELTTALAHALIVSSHLERVDPAGRSEGFIRRKAGPTRRVTLLNCQVAIYMHGRGFEPKMTDKPS